MQIPSTLVTKIVQAGAGTGKTESLAREIIMVAREFYSLSKRAPQLVATTFTERATAELRERVIQTVDKDPHSEAWLKEFVQDPDKLQISTLHGVFSRVLHRYGAFLGLDPEFSVLQGDEEKDLLRFVVRKSIAESEELGIVLDQFGFEESVKIISTLVEHYLLYGDHARPRLDWEYKIKSQMKALESQVEFVAKHAGEELTPKLAESVSKVEKFWNQKGIVAGDYSQTRKNLIEAIGEGRKPTVSKKAEHLKESIDAIWEILKIWKAESFDPDLNAKFIELSKQWENLTKAVVERLSETKRLRGCLGFSDLEFLTTRLVREFPHVKEKVSQSFDYWFIDEYQDTSPLQKELVFSFLREPWNAYFVGDPQQSIYLFRGADQGVFEETKALIKEKGGQILRLEKNYRSEPDLLKFMNLIFPKLEAQGKPQGKVCTDIILHEKDADQTAIIARQINNWLSQGFEFHDIAVLVRTNREAKNLSLELKKFNYPVFVHASGGFYDKREILDALSVLNFLISPLEDEPLFSLLRSPWVGAADSDILKWAQERKVAKEPLWTILLKITDLPSECEFTVKKLQAAQEDIQLTPLSFQFETLLAELGFFEYCLVEDGSGRREANLRKLVSNLRQAETRPGFSASQFLERAWADAEGDGEESEAPGFIEPRRINIMTVHKSKGLKFNNVIIPRCGQNYSTKHQTLERNPSGEWALQVMGLETEERVSPIALLDLKESRVERELKEYHRVFYVAVTRAARRLCLISQKEPGESSWLSQLKIDTSLGQHEGCYKVYEFDSSSTIPLYESNLAVEELKIKLETLQPRPKANTLLRKESFLSKIDLDDLPRVLQAQSFGLALHYIFDELKRSPERSVSELAQNALNRFNLKSHVDDEMIRKTLELSEPPIKEIFKSGFSEWDFTFREGESFYSGRIDLWGVVNGVCWVIDYKSARNPKKELRDKTKEQLEFYALAVSKTGIPFESIKIAMVLPQISSAEVLPLSSQQEVISRLSCQDQIETLNQSQ